MHYSDSGLNIALGTDGPASNNCLDMFREMFLSTGLQKGLLYDPSAISGIDVLNMATSNGARAMGLDSMDSIEIGKAADFIMIDLHQPNMQPINNPLNNLVYAASKANVLMTVVNGVVRYEKGEYFVGEDVDRIYQKCQDITDRIMER